MTENSINKFFQWIAEKSGDIANFITDSDKNNDKYVNKYEAYSYFNGNLDWKGNFTDSEFNQFWNKVDTLQNANKVGGTNNKNLYTLDNNELAAMENNVQAYTLINTFLNNLQVPASMAGIVSAADLKSKVSESLQNVVSNYISTHNNIDLAELEQLIQQQGNTAMVKSCADLYANGYFAKEIAKYKSELTGYASDSDKNWVTMINSLVNTNGLTLDNIVPTVKNIVSAYLATAKLGNGSENVNLLNEYGYDNSKMNDLQTSVITNKIRTNLNVDSATYKNYKAKFDEYVSRFIQDMLNGGKSFEELYNMNDLASQFRNSNYGAALNTLLTYSVIDPSSETTDALTDDDNNNGNKPYIKKPYINTGDEDKETPDDLGNFKPTSPGSTDDFMNFKPTVSKTTDDTDDNDKNNPYINPSDIDKENPGDLGNFRPTSPGTTGDFMNFELTVSGTTDDANNDTTTGNKFNFKSIDTVTTSTPITGNTLSETSKVSSLNDVNVQTINVTTSENTTKNAVNLTNKSAITDNRNTSSFYSRIYDELLTEFNNDADKAAAYAENIYQLSKTNGSAYRQIVEQVADMIADGDLGTSPSNAKIEAKIIALIIADIDKFAPDETTATQPDDGSNSSTTNTNNNKTINDAAKDLADLLPDIVNDSNAMNELVGHKILNGVELTYDPSEDTYGYDENGIRYTIHGESKFFDTTFSIDSNGKIVFADDNNIAKQIYSNLKDTLRNEFSSYSQDALNKIGGKEALEGLIQAAWITAYNAFSSSELHTAASFVKHVLRNLKEMLESIEEHSEYLDIYTSPSFSDASLKEGITNSDKFLAYTNPYVDEEGSIRFSNSQQDDIYKATVNTLLNNLKTKYQALGLSEAQIEKIFRAAQYEAITTLQTGEKDLPSGIKLTDNGLKLDHLVDMILYSFDKLLNKELANAYYYDNCAGMGTATLYAYQTDENGKITSAKCSNAEQTIGTLTEMYESNSVISLTGNTMGGKTNWDIKAKNSLKSLIFSIHNMYLADDSYDKSALTTAADKVKNLYINAISMYAFDTAKDGKNTHTVSSDDTAYEFQVQKYKNEGSTSDTAYAKNADANGTSPSLGLSIGFKTDSGYGVQVNVSLKCVMDLFTKFYKAAVGS